MRLSRGRSTPTRRAMWLVLLVVRSGFGRVASRASPNIQLGLGLRPSAPEVASLVVRRASDHVVWCSVVLLDFDAPVPTSQARSEGLLNLRLRRLARLRRAWLQPWR